MILMNNRFGWHSWHFWWWIPVHSQSISVCDGLPCHLTALVHCWQVPLSSADLRHVMFAYKWHTFCVRDMIFTLDTSIPIVHPAEHMTYSVILRTHTGIYCSVYSICCIYALAFYTRDPHETVHHKCLLIMCVYSFGMRQLYICRPAVPV